MAHSDREQNEIALQRAYYERRASVFDSENIQEGDEHFFALGIMVGLLDYLRVQTILDVGAGTGRAETYLRQTRPDIRIVGVEPSLQQREIGHQKGLPPDSLVAGDGTELHFADKSFDLVCEFGVLHHIKHPEQAIAEMLRVAKTAVFISDS